jgi:O-antigen/teichoic acid export membrane protein
MMFLLLAFFGRSILALVFGTYYGQAWAVLVILSVGQVVNALSGSCALTLMMTGQQKALMVIALASAAFQAGLGIGLSKVLGLAGVALAVAGVLVLQNAVMVVWVRAKTGVWTVASPAGLVQGGRVLLRSLS